MGGEGGEAVGGAVLEKVLLKYCERLVVVVLFSYSNMMVRCVMVTVSMLTLVFLMLIQHDEGRSLTYTMSCSFFFFKESIRQEKEAYASLCVLKTQ